MRLRAADLRFAVTFAAAAALVGSGAYALGQQLSGPAAAADRAAAPPSRVIAATAWIEATDDARRLVLEARLMTPCLNDAADLAGAGGFGVTGRSYLIEASIQPQPVCLTAIGEQDLRFETEIGDDAAYDDVALRIGDAFRIVPIRPQP